MTLQNYEITHLNIERWRKVKEAIRLELFQLRDGSILSIPCGIIAGRKGPIVTLAAAQHGDEWNGVYICHHLFAEIEPQDLAGTLVLLPVVNPLAFVQKSRVSSVDHIDMNRTYSFVKTRKSTEHIAGLLFEHIFSQSAYLLDLHTGGPGEYLPNVGVVEQGRVELALALNLGSVIVAEKDHGSLVPACERQSIPAFSIEIGRSLTIDYDLCDFFVKGMLNFLKTVGVLEGIPQTTGSQKLFTSKKIISAPTPGFFDPLVELGEEVSEDQPLCEVSPLFSSESQVITAPIAGTVLYLRREEMVGSGDSLVHIAYSLEPEER